MKPQDILFIITILFLLWKKNPKHFVVAGLICLALSMPLFHFWIFFTAQRLVYYAVGFFLFSIILLHKN